MKREKVRDRQAAGKISATHIIANPTLAREWIVFFKKDGGRSYFLVDESDEVMSFRRLDDAVRRAARAGHQVRGDPSVGAASRGPHWPALRARASSSANRYWPRASAV